MTRARRPSMRRRSPTRSTRLGLVAEPSFPAIEAHHDSVVVRTRRQVVDALAGLVDVAFDPALRGWGTAPGWRGPALGRRGGCDRRAGSLDRVRAGCRRTALPYAAPVVPRGHDGARPHSPPGRSRLGLVGGVGLAIAGEGERMALGTSTAGCPRPGRSRWRGCGGKRPHLRVCR